MGIEKDYKKIRKVVDTTPVVSIEGIAKATDLSEDQVRATLSKHPRVEAKIMAQMEKNKEELKEFVIDASISGIEDIENTLLKICAEEKKLILTSVTMRELDRMQKFHDIYGISASHILAMAAENYKSFHNVLIDETIGDEDECIINYCANNKDNVVLLTADKYMAVRARMHEVETQYFKHNATSMNCRNYKMNTLLDVVKTGDRLYVPDCNNAYKNILVISNGIEYAEGIRELKIGDDVYVVTKKHEYITFAHYQITSLQKENNCNIIYTKRIYNPAEINKLPKRYRPFIKDFRYKYNL